MVTHKFLDQPQPIDLQMPESRLTGSTNMYHKEIAFGQKPKLSAVTHVCENSHENAANQHVSKLPLQVSL